MTSNWKDRYEVVVAVTCVFCDEIIIGNLGKRLCPKCYQKWTHVIPRRVKFDLLSRSSFHDLPKELLIWKKIIDYKKQGIYSFHERCG